MIRVRQVFQATYGRGDGLVDLFKEFHSKAEIPDRANSPADSHRLKCSAGAIRPASAKPRSAADSRQMAEIT
jgi:hypothetical protein